MDIYVLGKKHRHIIFSIILLVMLYSKNVLALYEENGDKKFEGYKEVTIVVHRLPLLTIENPDGMEMTYWDVYHERYIYLLRGNILEKYDGETIVKSIKLHDGYEHFVITSDETIYLMSEDHSHILVLKGALQYKIVIPNQFKSRVGHISVSKEGVLLIEVLNEYFRYTEDGNWVIYPWFHLLGHNDLAYYCKGGVIQTYDLFGNLKTTYYTPFNLSPLYSVGVDFDGTWYLFCDSLADKKDGDIMNFMTLNVDEKTFGFFSIPFGSYSLNQGKIYRLEQKNKKIYIESWRVKD